MPEDLKDDLAITPQRAVTVSDLAYERLKKAIVSGLFRPGERLVESVLASRLQVSRTPLRAAITSLEMEGLLERQPRGGVRVPPFSAQEIEDLYEVRAALESLAAMKAARRVAEGELTAEELSELERMRVLLESRLVNQESEEGVDTRPYTTGFHLLIHRLSRNQKCISILENVMDAMKRYRAFVPQERSKRGLEEHLQILAAVIRGDPQAAEAEMRSHIADSGVIYKEILSTATQGDQ
jgi:DNA-binding GntR family transcriptional regulator